MRQETFDRFPPEIQTRLTALVKRLSMESAALRVVHEEKKQQAAAYWAGEALKLTPQEIFNACAARRDQERAEIAKYQRESL